MKKYLRFRDLKERGVVNSWPALKRKVEREGFPKGRMIGPNARAWTDDEVDAWYASRPVEGPAPRGIARKLKLAAEARTATPETDHQ